MVMPADLSATGSPCSNNATYQPSSRGYRWSHSRTFLAALPSSSTAMQLRSCSRSTGSTGTDYSEATRWC